MKHCVRCAKEIPDIADFCRFCGAKQILDEESQNNGPDNFTRRAVLKKTIDELLQKSTALHSQMINVQANIVSTITELMTTIASSEDHYSYVNAAHKIKSLKSVFHNWHPEYFQLIKEIKALILKESGEDIDISDLDFDISLFDISLDTEHEDIAEDILWLMTMLDNYFSSLSHIDSVIYNRLDKIANR